jgi:PQQ-like domain
VRIPLTGGAYTARSVIASAQRQVNLYTEPMPPQQTEPMPAALYPTAGLRLLGTAPEAPIRGIHQAINGALYVAAGSGIYHVNDAYSFSGVGTVTAGKTTPVSMSDNGVLMAIVDGSSTGWQLTLASDAYVPITDPVGGFVGGDRVDFSDTYWLFNVPGTPQFQSSDSNALTFDPLWVASKAALGDLLVAVVVAKRELWLIGKITTEVWYNAGSEDFPWATQPNVLIDHGCAAKYSPAEADNAVFWLSRNRQGQGIVIMGAGYEATRISTYAMEAEFATYSRIDDAIGMTWQVEGHVWYVLTFPHADKTWAYDITTKLWSELVWLDSNGTEHRHRANCAAAARGLIIVGDWQNGNLYALDPAVFTDNDQPIMRLRAYPHLLADGKRIFYQRFIADLEGGNAASTNDEVSLDWSDDRGRSYGNPVKQTIGDIGEYRTSLLWLRLGMARDRVFRLSWSLPCATALQGAWIESAPAES